MKSNIAVTTLLVVSALQWNAFATQNAALPKLGLSQRTEINTSDITEIIPVWWIESGHKSGAFSLTPIPKRLCSEYVAIVMAEQTVIAIRTKREIEENETHNNINL